MHSGVLKERIPSSSPKIIHPWVQLTYKRVQKYSISNTISDDLNAVGRNQDVNLLERFFEAFFEIFEASLCRTITRRDDLNLDDIVHVLDSAVLPLFLDTAPAMGSR